MNIMWWVDGNKTDNLSVENRGLAYGDGLFETMRVVDGGIPLLHAHLHRLSHGVAVLDLNIDVAVIKQGINQALSSVSDRGWGQSVIKLIVFRDGLSQGYRYTQSLKSHYLIRASELLLPEKTSVLHTRICNYVLSTQSSLAGVKHLNRLDQVMASRELEAEQEGLMLDSEGFIQEGISSNIFIVKGNEVLTPELSKCGVKGVMRDFLISQIEELVELEVDERAIHCSELKAADEVIFANAVHGVRNAASVKDTWTSERTRVGDYLRALLLEKLSKSFTSF